jgi:hypothetical protein
MAKITITIEDLPNGAVKVAAEPTFETMMKMHLSGDGLTAAHGYAFNAINEIRRTSKQSQIMKVRIPRIQ